MAKVKFLKAYPEDSPVYKKGSAYSVADNEAEKLIAEKVAEPFVYGKKSKAEESTDGEDEAKK